MGQAEPRMKKLGPEGPRQDKRAARAFQPAQPGLLQRLLSRLVLATGSEEDPEQDVQGGALLFERNRIIGERYRTLAWQLDQLRLRQVCQVLMVTSSAPGEGKSTVALNLAAVLAERSEHKVLLVDFDLRRPKVHRILGGRSPGLVEVLDGRADLDEALHQESTLGFAYLPVVAAAPDPLKLLSHSTRLERLMQAVRNRYDYVILDAPPVLPVTDPVFLAELVDAILFVVRAGDTSGRMLSRALGMLRKDKLLGLIFNGTGGGAGLGYERYAQYYTAQSFTAQQHPPARGAGRA